MTAKDKIKTALLDLMKKKPLSQIQVKDVSEHAQVSRSSFYRNYDSIYDVVAEIEKDFFDGLREVNKGCLQAEISADMDVPDRFVLNSLRYQQKHADVMLTLSGPYGEPSFREEVTKLFNEFFVARMAFHHVKVEYSDFYEVFVTSGHIDAIRYWLTKRQDISPERMAVIIAKLMYGFFYI